MLTAVTKYSFYPLSHHLFLVQCWLFTMSFSSDTLSSSSLEVLRYSQARWDLKSLPQGSLFMLRSLPSWVWLENLQLEVARRHPNRIPDNLKWHNLTLRRSSSTPRLHQYCLWDRCEEDFLLCLHEGDGVHCSHTLCLFTLADPTLLQRSFKCNTPYFFTPHQLDLTETETVWLSRFPAVTHTSVLAALLSECFKTSLSTLVQNSRKFEHSSKHYVKHTKRKLSRRLHEKNRKTHAVRLESQTYTICQLNSYHTSCFSSCQSKHTHTHTYTGSAHFLFYQASPPSLSPSLL